MRCAGRFNGKAGRQNRSCKRPPKWVPRSCKFATTLRQKRGQSTSCATWPRWLPTWELAIELGATGCTQGHLRACLRAASLLNAPILRMVIAADSSGSPAELENTIRNSLPELCERGVCLAIENHFDLSPHDLKQLVETIASPSVGICLDVFNSIYHLSSQAETLAWLAPYAITVHVKDVDLRRQNTGFYLYGCRLGIGRLDFESLLSALQRSGSTPALLLESWMDRLESKVETCAQEEPGCATVSSF
jgi:3-oxoisoapionate decarboxylase